MQRERKWRKPKRNWVKIVAIAIVVTGVVYVGAIFAVDFVLTRVLPRGPYAERAPTAFSREVWLASGSDRGGARYLMLDDLLRSHPLVGLGRAEVVELLGPPSASPAGFGTSYYLGPINHPFREGSVWLALVFDDTDRVSALEMRPQ
ncbi:MAG: hypothetical protein K8S98_13195 [Planctomycetes bacterium]|nr:hypothetical protein [Planctomycetota bacterium]